MAKECRGRYHDGSVLDHVSVAEVIDRFTPLQLDAFRAIVTLYASRRANPSPKRLGKHHALLLCREAFRMFPIGALTMKPSRGRELRGRVYDFFSGRL